jgi:hypothetical protein
MYKSFIVGLGLVMMLASVDGCQKAASNTGGTGGGGAGTTGASGTGTAGGSGSASNDCMMITTESSLMGNSCNNVHDKCFLNNNSEMVRSIGGKCATGALKTPTGESCVKYAGNPTAPEAIKCWTDCARAELMKATNDVASDACLACSDAVVNCGAKYCLSQCISDSLAPKCVQCLCTTHPEVFGAGTASGNCLLDVFEQCTGFKAVPDKQGCTADVRAAIAAAGTGGTPAVGTAGASGTTGSGGSAGTAGASGASGGAGASGHSGGAGGASGAGGAGGAGAGGASGTSGGAGAAGH